MKHHSSAGPADRSYVPGIEADDFAERMAAGGRGDSPRLPTDDTSAGILKAIMADGTYTAMRRIKAEGGLAPTGTVNAGSLGGGTVGTPMEGGGTMRAGRGPNIRYGRQHVPGGSNGLGRFDGAAPGANGFGLTNAPYTAPLDAKGEGGHLSPRELFSYLKDHGATDNEATLLTGAAGSESSFNPNAIHDVNGKNGPGHGLWGHNDHRIDMRGLSWQQQADRALAEVKRDYADRVNAAKTPEELADAEMHYERPRGYHGNNPRGGDNYTGRLNTIRRFSHGFGTMGFDPAKPEMASGAADGGPKGAYPAWMDDRSKRELAGVNAPLARDFLAASQATGLHFRITQGLRTQAEADANARSGRGVRNSQHLYGAAADLVMQDAQGRDIRDRGAYKRFADALTAHSRATGGNARWLGDLPGRWGSDIVHFDQGIGYGQSHKANPYGSGGPTAADIAAGNKEIFSGPQNPFLAKQRDAEKAVLPQRTAPAPLLPGHHAASVDFDHSSLDTAIAKVDTLHGKLRGLKATASVDINHKHTHHGDRLTGNAPRFSPYRSHEPASAGRILV